MPNYLSKLKTNTTSEDKEKKTHRNIKPNKCGKNWKVINGLAWSAGHIIVVVMFVAFVQLFGAIFAYKLARKCLFKWPKRTRIERNRIEQNPKQNSNLVSHLTDWQSAKLIFNWANCVGPLFAGRRISVSGSTSCSSPTKWRWTRSCRWGWKWKWWHNGSSGRRHESQTTPR